MLLRSCGGRGDDGDHLLYITIVLTIDVVFYVLDFSCKGLRVSLRGGVHSSKVTTSICVRGNARRVTRRLGSLSCVSGVKGRGFTKGLLRRGLGCYSYIMTSRAKFRGVLYPTCARVVNSCPGRRRSVVLSAGALRCLKVGRPRIKVGLRLSFC